MEIGRQYGELLFRQFGCDNLDDYYVVSNNINFTEKFSNQDSNYLKLILENFHVIGDKYT